MTQARIRLDDYMSALPRTAWEKLIYDANLGDIDTEIATRYFINKQCQIDIGIALDADRSTISRRISKIKASLKNRINA